VSVASICYSNDYNEHDQDDVISYIPILCLLLLLYLT
jgi:hypothetical protein